MIAWVTIRVIVAGSIPVETGLLAAEATAVAVETSNGVVSVERLDMIVVAVEWMILAVADVVDPASSTFILTATFNMFSVRILYARGKNYF